MGNVKIKNTNKKYKTKSCFFSSRGKNNTNCVKPPSEVVGVPKKKR